MPKHLFNGKYQSFKSTGVVNAGGSVAFKLVNTSTDKNTFSDWSLSATNSNPVTLDSEGRAHIYLEQGYYDVTVLDSSGSTVETQSYVTDEFATLNTSIPSIILNGSFESGTGAGADNWSFSAVGTAQRGTTDKVDGQYAAIFTSSGSGGGSVITDFYPVSANRTYRITWEMKSTDAAVRNVVDVLWYDASQAQLGGGSASTNLYDDSTTNPTDWTVKTASVVPPSGAYYGRLDMVGCHSSDVTTGSTYYDNVTMNIVSGAAVSSITKTSNYTITSTDLADTDHLIVYADASGGSITITLPAAATYTNKIIEVIASTDPSGNHVQINNNAATRIYELYQQNDFYKTSSDGTSIYKHSARTTIRVHAARSLTLTFLASTWTKVAFDTEIEDTAGKFTHTTSAGEFTVPLTGVYEIHSTIQNDSISDGSQWVGSIYKDGTAFRQIFSDDASKPGTVTSVAQNGGIRCSLTASAIISIYGLCGNQGNMVAGIGTNWVTIVYVGD